MILAITELKGALLVGLGATLCMDLCAQAAKIPGECVVGWVTHSSHVYFGVGLYVSAVVLGPLAGV